MNPKHNNPTRPKYTAHAPYNFVPLPEKAIPAPENLPGMDQYYDERYSGVIGCKITTRSPVYVRGMAEPDFFAELKEKPVHEMDDKKKRQYARFYSRDDKGLPAIPGSSLRGMIRSIVEVAAFAKMQWVTDAPLFFQALRDLTSLGTYYRNSVMRNAGKGNFVPLVQGGYLVRKRDQWFIRPAQIVQGVTFARILKKKIQKMELQVWREHNRAKEIWVRLGERSYERLGKNVRLEYLCVQEAKNAPAKDFKKALLVTGVDISNNKNMEVVLFPPDSSSELIKVSDEIFWLEQVCYRLEEPGARQDEALKPFQPVFYLLEEGGLVFFGRTIMFPLPYIRTPSGLVPTELSPEASQVKLDIAESIFGFTPRGKNDQRPSLAGRVSFCDALVKPNQDEIWLSKDPIIPEILSEPKPTAFQHYLTQETTPDGALNHYDSPPPHDTVIRGHKFYWHKGPGRLSDIEDDKLKNLQIDSQHTLISPVKPGVEFQSKIYFENLSKIELGAILWALVLPGEKDKEYCHKIGMGKPLGLGSIKIIPKLFLDYRKSRYERLFDERTWHQARRQEMNIEGFIKCFEKYVFGKLCKEERGDVDQLAKTNRIQMFFKLLEWPGPADHSVTGYMTGSKSRKRSVLPDPLHVKPGQE